MKNTVYAVLMIFWFIICLVPHFCLAYLAMENRDLREHVESLEDRQKQLEQDVRLAKQDILILENIAFYEDFEQK